MGLDLKHSQASAAASSSEESQAHIDRYEANLGAEGEEQREADRRRRLFADQEREARKKRGEFVARPALAVKVGSKAPRGASAARPVPQGGEHPGCPRARSRAGNARSPRFAKRKRSGRPPSCTQRRSGARARGLLQFVCSKCA